MKSEWVILDFFFQLGCDIFQHWKPWITYFVLFCFSSVFVALLLFWLLKICDGIALFTFHTALMLLLLYSVFYYFLFITTLLSGRKGIIFFFPLQLPWSYPCKVFQLLLLNWWQSIFIKADYKILHTKGSIC